MSNEGLGLSVADRSDNASKENDMVSLPFRILASSPLCTYDIISLRYIAGRSLCNMF